MSDWIGIALIVAALVFGGYSCVHEEELTKRQLITAGFHQDFYGKWVK